MSPRIFFRRCEDCGGRGFIPIRIPLVTGRHPWTGAPCAAAGGGAVRCTCAGGYRAVVARRSA
jgi:hypothetical protein